MGRIRTIKPELLEDQRTATLNDAQWRLFVSLILLADDYGNLRAHPIQLSGAAFWGSDPARPTRALLDKLVEVGLVALYEVSGQPYAHLIGWRKHQRVDRPGTPKCPPPEGSPGAPRGADAGDSRESREDAANGSRDSREPSAESENTQGSGQIVEFESPTRIPREPLATDLDLDREGDQEGKGNRKGGVAIWLAKDWFAAFKLAWATSYAALSYWAIPADGKATGDLEEILSRLAPTDALAAQERAPAMFSEFLAQDSRQIREARHPWAWFVQRFNGLRLPQREATPRERDVSVGHAPAKAKSGKFAIEGRKF